MDNEGYRFKLGNFGCTVVSDGTHTYHSPAPALFANAPQDRLAHALRTHGLDLEQWKAYVSPYPTLLVHTGQSLVLVDTGAGDMVPSTGKLIANLEAENVAPGDIDAVILPMLTATTAAGSSTPTAGPLFPRPAM